MLENVSINIPFQKDSESRLNNLINLIQFLRNNFNNITIKVCEMDTKRNLFIDEGIRYFFLKQENFFCKAECLNLMALRTNELYIINHDVDFINKPEFYILAIKNLSNNDACLLHNKTIYEIENINTLKEDKLKSNNYFSGAIAYNRSYLLDNKENINIKCFGYESEEREIRFDILNTKTSILDRCGYTVKHDITRNSNKKNSHYPSNQIEFDKIKKMNKLELIKYINDIPVRQS